MRPFFLAAFCALFAFIVSAEVVEYSDLVQSHPTDGTFKFLSLGDKFTSFDRKAPSVLDPQFLQEFGALGYLHVNFDPNGENPYEGTSKQYVASLVNASVCGSEGDVWDSAGRLYHSNTWVRHSIAKLEVWKEEAESYGVKHFKRLAVAVHRVSFMYFHFMTEVLPKIAKFAPFLEADPDLKLLTYGSEFELAWIQKLGIRESQLVVFDPLYAYQADELLITNPVEIARTPKEDIEKVLNSLSVPPPLPTNKHTDLIYVSRRLATDRRQTNEESLLQALHAEAEAKGLRLVVHDGNTDMTPQENIDIFRHAKVVMGPNGAGLAHMMFAPPGAILIELMFINNTGMDLWHLTAALNQEYYMVPLPRSYWLDPGSDVPIEQAVSTLRWALGVDSGAEPACPKGSAPDASGECMVCPPGTFSTGYDKQCMECSPGWVAERTGSGSCHVCLSSTYASGPMSCTACPKGTLSAMPGSTKVEECLDESALEKVKQRWLPAEAVVSKVSAYYKSITRRQSQELAFTQLPVSLKDRILSELDACSSYTTNSAYGCFNPPSSSPPPPPPTGTVRELSFRALGNGPLSDCSVYYYDSSLALKTTSVTTDEDGYAEVNVTAPSDVALLALTGCSEERSGRTGLNFTGVMVPITNDTSVVNPISGIATILVFESGYATASKFHSNYTTALGQLGLTTAMINEYGATSAEVAAFDFEDATFYPEDDTEKTLGVYMSTQQLAVYGIVNVWAPFLAGLTKSGITGKIGSKLAVESLYSAMAVRLAAKSFNMSSATVQKALFELAYRASTNVPNFRRHLLDADSTALAAVANQTAALSDAVSQSVALQVNVLTKLAAAVAGGTAYDGDLDALMVLVAQVSKAQSTSIAGAAAQLAAGTLTVDSFRSSYTGDALLKFIESIEVDLPHKKKDKHIGAIVGGVVGGFFGLVLIGVIVFVIIRRQKSHVQPKAQGEP